MKRLALVTVVLALLGAPVWAQQPDFPKPGPEHEFLKKMEGTWDCVIKGMGGDSKGKMVYKMELGGLWLVSNFEGEVFGSKFSGKGMDTYDTTKKKYCTVWFDSMSTSPMLFEGSYDKDKKTLTLIGEGPTPDGKTGKFKSTTEIKSDNEMVFKMALVGPDGKDNVMMTIEYKRAAKKK